jgi:hypothetical protein
MPSISDCAGPVLAPITLRAAQKKQSAFRCGFNQSLLLRPAFVRKVKGIKILGRCDRNCLGRRDGSQFANHVPFAGLLLRSAMLTGISSMHCEF